MRRMILATILIAMGGAMIHFWPWKRHASTSKADQVYTRSGGVIDTWIVLAKKEAVVKSSDPAADFPHVQMSSLGLMNVAALAGGLEGRRDYAALVEKFEPARIPEGDGMLILAIPADTVARLAAQSKSERAALADRWRRTEEFPTRSYDLTATRRLLDELYSLSSRAASGGGQLFICCEP